MFVESVSRLISRVVLSSTPNTRGSLTLSHARKKISTGKVDRSPQLTYSEQADAAMRKFRVALLRTPVDERPAQFDAEFNKIHPRTLIGSKVSSIPPVLDANRFALELAGLTQTIHLLPPDIQAERLLAVDRLCTQVLAPRLPQYFHPRTITPRISFAEAPLRHVLGDALAKFYDSLSAKQIVANFEDLKQFAEKFVAATRIHGFRALTKRIPNLDRGVRYDALLDLLIESKKMPLPLTAAIAPDICKQLQALPEELRLPAPNFREHLSRRFMAGESKPHAMHMLKMVSKMRTVTHETFPEIEMLAHNATPSQTLEGKQIDANYIRKCLAFIPNAPQALHASLFAVIYQMARRCSFYFGSNEIDNYVAALPKFNHKLLRKQRAAEFETFKIAQELLDTQRTLHQRQHLN